MALRDQLKTSTGKMPGFPCSICRLIDDLSHDEAELDALNLMLYGTSGRGWSASRIYDALKAEGYTVGQQSINKHRGKRCRGAK